MSKRVGESLKCEILQELSRQHIDKKGMILAFGKLCVGALKATQSS